MGVPTIATDPYAADLYDGRLPNGTFWIRQTARAVADRYRNADRREDAESRATKLSDSSSSSDSLCRERLPEQQRANPSSPRDRALHRPRRR